MVNVPDAPVNLANDVSVTSDSVIGFTWSDGLSNGGQAILDYRVSFDLSTGNYVELASGVTNRFYTTTNTLVAGQTYRFKVEARNSVGYSAYSQELSVLVAQEPDQPQAPITSIVGDKVKIQWVVPYDGSSAITSYNIVIRESDGVTFTEDSVNCNGADATVIAEFSCSVLISDLIVAPYHLPWGSSIYAKVIATNIVGDSLQSAAGNGAIILTFPDPPVDLSNVSTVTANTQIGLSWNEGPANGGSSVIDY